MCNRILISIRELQHDRIIRFIGVLALENDADLVYEYVPGGSLCGLLQSTVPISDRLKFSILLQVAMGMQHVHSRGIIHRDLNSKNILVCPFLLLEVLRVFLALCAVSLI